MGGRTKSGKLSDESSLTGLWEAAVGGLEPLAVGVAREPMRSGGRFPSDISHPAAAPLLVSTAVRRRADQPGTRRLDARARGTARRCPPLRAGADRLPESREGLLGSFRDVGAQRL